MPSRRDRQVVYCKEKKENGNPKGVVKELGFSTAIETRTVFFILLACPATMSELAAASSSSSAVVPAQAVPTINRPLPPVPPEARRLVEGKEPISILLFYQYVEPPWTDKECSSALKHFLALGKEHSICGRGRCAKEGLNCTLTGNAAGLRAFCEALRAWKPELFNQTDFKFTDGLPASRRFKALTVRKTDELVAYGLAGERAPALAASSAKHVEATEYHELLKQVAVAVAVVAAVPRAAQAGGQR